MEIKWSTDLLEELNQIVTFLKRNSIGILLETLGGFFIEKHMKYITIDNYSMNFIDNVDPSIISDGEYKLAFICELIHIKKKKMINVYACFAEMINYCAKKKFKPPHNKLTHKTSFLVALMKEFLQTDDTKTIIFAIDLVKEIVSRNSDVNLLSSLLTESQNLDLSMLTHKSIRDISEILNTERTVYVRFLFVLCYDLVKNKIKDKTIKIHNYDDLIFKLTSPFYETIIYIIYDNIY